MDISANMISPLAFTIIIPAFNEAESIGEVLRELATMLPAGTPHEVIVVNDGSADATAAQVRAVMAGFPALRLLSHERCAGKSRAIATGAMAARGEWIATMDADGQNDPADILAMLAVARSAGGQVLVAGQRPKREDTWAKRVSSRIANGFRRAVLNDACPDTGCGMKVFPREAFLLLPVFEGLHRFLPALFNVLGVRLIMHKVTDRRRLAGQSKYTNFGRALVGVPDLLTVVWLRHRVRQTGRVTEA
jgi:dolichol-phosphate mannosyltransferase